jgi:hypothetical protein
MLCQIGAQRGSQRPKKVRRSDQNEPLVSILSQPGLQKLRNLKRKPLDLYLVRLRSGFQRRSHRGSALLVSAGLVGEQLLTLRPTLRMLNRLQYPPLIAPRSNLKDSASAGIANHHPGALHRFSQIGM